MPAASPFKWITDFLHPEDEDEEFATDDTPAQPPTQPQATNRRDRSHLTLRSEHQGGMVIRHPRTLEERMTVGMDLKQRRMVTLNLTRLPEGDARYFLEFVYGVIYALDATAEKVTDNIYLLAPHGVAVENEISAPPSEAEASYLHRQTARPGPQQEELFWQAR